MKVKYLRADAETLESCSSIWGFSAPVKPTSFVGCFFLMRQVSNAKTCTWTAVKKPLDYIPIMPQLHPILTSLFC